MTLRVQHDRQETTYRAYLDDQPAGFLRYRPNEDGTVWTAYTTQVSAEFEGHGVGSALVRALDADTREAGVEINPTCWFVAGWLERHPS